MTTGWAPDNHPRPPVNVRVVLPGGREIPVECVYTGVVAGLHQWQVAWTLAEMPTGLRCDMLPERSIIVMDVQAGR